MNKIKCCPSYATKACHLTSQPSRPHTVPPESKLPLNILLCNNFIKPHSRRRGGFLLCLWFIIFFFSFVGEQTQTPGPLGQSLSPNDVTISQLQAISQLFSSYPPSGPFCQVSKLTIQKEHGCL